MLEDADGPESEGVDAPQHGREPIQISGKLLAYYANGKMATIHVPVCRTVLSRVVGPELGPVRHVGTVMYGFSPRTEQAKLVTVEEAEELPAWKACGICRPPLSRCMKTAPASRPKPTRFITMAPRHIGREFETLDGEPLGALTMYTVTEDTVTVRFDTGERTAGHDHEVIMIPRRDTTDTAAEDDDDPHSGEATR